MVHKVYSTKLYTLYFLKHQELLLKVFARKQFISMPTFFFEIPRQIFSQEFCQLIEKLSGMKFDLLEQFT